jgi:hypothetical protein
MRSAIAALVLLPVLASGAAQARPLAAGATSAGVLADLWQWAVPSLAPAGWPTWLKAGGDMDPNGRKHPCVTPGGRDHGDPKGTTVSSQR